MNYWRRDTIARAIIVHTCSFFLVATPLMARFALADEIVQEADKGRNTGANLLLNYQTPTVIDAPPPADAADYFDASGNLRNEMWSQELFPGYNPADPSQITDLSALMGDPANLATQGIATGIALGGGAGETSEAYNALQDGTTNPAHATTDMSAEVFLDASREIIAGDSTMLDEILMSCEEEVVDGGDGVDTVTRLEDIYTCSQAPVGVPENCVVRRNLQLVAIETKEILAVDSGGACATPIPPTIEANNTAYNAGSTAQLNSGSFKYCRTTTEVFDTPGWRSALDAPGRDWSFLIAVPTGPGDYEILGHSAADICGLSAGTDCNASADTFEIECNGYGLGGALMHYPGKPPPTPVEDWCAAEKVEYTANCEAANASSCGATGEEHWNLFQAAPEAGQVGLCSVRRSGPLVFDWSGYPAFSGMEIERRFDIAPGEPGDDIERVWGGYYCGTHTGRNATEIEQACTASADAIENLCRNLRTTWPNPNIGNVFQISRPVEGPSTQNCSPATELGPPFSYAGCPAAREAGCLTLRNSHYNACLGGSPSGPMNGVDTVTASGLPAGEVRNETLFGTDVEITEDPFDPTTHGLAAGQYVIANYNVTGEGVDDFTITDGGSYGSNWDYAIEVTTTDSPLFTVEATLYEIVANEFVFEGCSQADVNNVNTGYCGGSIVCTDLQLPCRTVDGVEVCEQPGISDGITELLLPWNDFAGGTPEMCWEADVQINECTIAHDCFTSGECVADCGDLPPALQAECEAPACWIEASTGTEICLDSTAETWVNNLGEPGYVDDCADLLSDPACVLRPERTCVEGMEDDTDPTICFLRSVYFDCGRDVTVPGIPGADDQEVSCAGDFRCFGDECANSARESNPDFVRAATAATTITEMTKDINCDIDGDPTSCKLFEGSDERCRDPRGIALGLIPDCCKESREAGQSGGDFIQYMQLARYTYELAQKPFVASYLSQSAAGSAVQSAISVGDPVSKAIGSVSTHISNGFSSALSWAGFTPVEAASEAVNIAGDVAASPTMFGPVQQFVATGVQNFLDSIGLDAFADQLFESTGEGIVTGWAEQGLGKMVASVISIIGTIYLIYSILKILGSIFFKCKDEELEFGIQQVNRMCHYVGDYCSKKIRIAFIKKCLIETKTYCCYSSPLARIMNEQLREQGIGGDWGTAKEPICEGITIADLDTVDWDLVDLSEWEAILFEAGLVPDPRDPPLNFIPTDIHPGAATGGTGEGVDSVTLNLEAIDTVMPEMEAGRTILEGEGMSQSDPELMPWYN